MEIWTLYMPENQFLLVYEIVLYWNVFIFMVLASSRFRPFGRLAYLIHMYTPLPHQVIFIISPYTTTIIISHLRFVCCRLCYAYMAQYIHPPLPCLCNSISCLNITFLFPVFYQFVPVSWSGHQVKSSGKIFRFS